MSKPLPFTDETFDIIFCPPSVCYIKKVEPLLEECARILKEEGILMITFENGLNYICDAEDESRIVQSLPFNPLEDPSLFGCLKPASLLRTFMRIPTATASLMS